jgi:hypothetical protein
LGQNRGEGGMANIKEMDNKNTIIGEEILNEL